MEWQEDDPAEPGWYWLCWKTYVGSERFEYTSVCAAYVQIKQIYTNGVPGDKFIEAFSNMGRNNRPDKQIDLGKLLSPQWAGPIAAPQKTNAASN